MVFTAFVNPEEKFFCNNVKTGKKITLNLKKCLDGKLFKNFWTVAEFAIQKSQFFSGMLYTTAKS